MKIKIIFSDDVELDIADRADYYKPKVQEILRAHRTDRRVKCNCREDVGALLMHIVLVPETKNAFAEGQGETPGTGGNAGCNSAKDELEKRKLYLRRDAKTSHLHARGCPNTLRFRDETKASRGEKEYPLSIFGPPRKSTSQAFGFSKDGGGTGRHLGDFPAFCNHVINAAAYEAGSLARKPFGTPSPQLLFASLFKQILEFKMLSRATVTPFQAAEAKKCRLEFGLCRYKAFGPTIPFPTGDLFLPVSIADEEGRLRDASYCMEQEVFKNASDQVRRLNSYINPPYLWIAIISSSQRIVRYWQWPVVIYGDNIVLTDSNPETEFVIEALWRGEVVFKVRTVEAANAVIRLLVPEAGPILSKCDFITWNGRFAALIEVVKRDEDEDEDDYWSRLKTKECQKGGYLDLQIPRKLGYERVDMRFQLGLGRSA